MRCVVQRVAQASVVGGGETATIGGGVCVLVGISANDNMQVADSMIKQILALKAFHSRDDSGSKRWTMSCRDAKADVLLVPQFTLHARIKSGRPSFHLAMPPSTAHTFFEDFVNAFRIAYSDARVEKGMFGAHMQVSLVNDGPVTFILESE